MPPTTAVPYRVARNGVSAAVSEATSLIRTRLSPPLDSHRSGGLFLVEDASHLQESLAEDLEHKIDDEPTNDAEE